MSDADDDLPLRRWLPPYLLFMAAIGALLSVAALQDYRRGGGTRDWEPILWEFSSVACMTVLALAVGRWTGFLRGRPRLQQLAGHLLGAIVFNLLHVAGMFGLRFLVYGLVGVEYHPNELPELLLYEGVKDLVSYALTVMLASGFWAARAARQRERELERTRRELAEARAERLAEQLQPHFLFNCLNLISSVMYEDVARADALLCQLADLLRQTLAAQQAGEHRLDEELALVRPFLALMQARFGEQRLKVVIEVPPEAGAVRIPALLLLSPVENAIKHDVATHRGAVTVRLQASLRDGRLQLTVDNSGVREAGRPDGGLGLRNLRERLAARYGEAARLEFGPFEGGMRLHLDIPA
jgi:sensor histidine kinase YesM